MARRVLVAAQKPLTSQLGLRGPPLALPVRRFCVMSELVAAKRLFGSLAKTLGLQTKELEAIGEVKIELPGHSSGSLLNMIPRRRTCRVFHKSKASIARRKWKGNSIWTVKWSK